MSNSKVNFYSKIQSQIWLASDFFCSNSLPGLNHRLSFYCILALPRFSTSRPHCMLGNSQKFCSHSDLPPKFCACRVFQWSQIPKYAVVGQEIHQQSSPKATSFRSGHFNMSTSNKPNSPTKYITLLASLRKWTLSYRHA